MKKHQCNKLVRDKIPNILIKENKAFKASHVKNKKDKAKYWKKIASYLCAS